MVGDVLAHGLALAGNCLQTLIAHEDFAVVDGCTGKKSPSSDMLSPARECCGAGVRIVGYREGELGRRACQHCAA
jgi:hypothetical protein